MLYCKKFNLKPQKEELVLRNQNISELRIDSSSLDINGRHRLFFSCEDSSCSFLKNESGAELLYMLIDDSLNFEKAEKNRYCLDMSCQKPLPYAKRIMKKIVWQPLKYGLYSYSNFSKYSDDGWSFGISAKTEKLQKETGGYLQLRADVWFVKDGVSPHDTITPPDETHIIDIPEGTYPYSVLRKSIQLKKDSTACVTVTLEGENYSGNVYFESPFLSDYEGRNMLPEFEKANIGLERFGWLGQNLSKREWPVIEVAVNGKVVFDGEIFLKVHRFSPVEVSLPDGCFKEGENVISIKYKSEYIDAIPLLFNEVFLLEKEKTDFELVKCPEEIAFGKTFALLVEKECKGVQFESEDLELVEITDFDEFNLSVISVKAIYEKNNISFKLKCGETEKEYTINRCIRKSENDVISGSGDMIYINIESVESVCDYIKWYVANDIGILVTIRQVYRWGGQRFVNPEVWELFTKLCEKLGLMYVHISDGRDIPGIATNPTEKMLEGANFLGRQLHERDGQLFYWDFRPREIQAPLEEFYDLAVRLGREHPETVEGAYRPFNVEWKDNTYSFRRNFCKTDDIKDAYSIAAEEIRNLTKDNFTRHTGPSVLFKYFYENGFGWLGAETMDGATESLISFMRGAARAYGIEKTGVHLALQWGSYPHDTKQRFRRYLLSLYIPYMHGVTDINTEEGLWFIEAYYDYFNRLSEVCEKNREQNSRFNKFVKTHNRTGTFYTPIAFLHGRLDGWNGFSNASVFGMPDMTHGDDGKSWSLLKLFYPNNAGSINGFERTGLIPADTDKEVGIFSGTPYGCVDAIPVEKGDFSHYSLLVFAGYNKAESDDLDRIYSYVSDGGTLVCTWAHFTDTTVMTDIKNYDINIVKHPITEMFSDGMAEFVADNVDGMRIKVCENVTANCAVLEQTDSGKPLVCSFSIGEGKVILVNTLYYPGNDSVMPVYTDMVKKLTEQILANEDVSVICGDDVEYTVFMQNDGKKHIYLTAVDWYNLSENPRSAKIGFCGNSYDINMNFGDIVKIVTDGKTAVYPECDKCEVLNLSENSFTLQGFGKQNFRVLHNGIEKIISVDFDNSPVKKIKLI